MAAENPLTWVRHRTPFRCHAFAVLLLYGAVLAVLQPACLWADLPETELLFRTGHYAECVASADKALADHPRQEPYWVLKLRAELTLGRYPIARETLAVGLKEIPNSLPLRWYGRDACRFTQELETATQLETEMIDLLKKSPWQYSDTRNQILVGRWLLSQRADPKQVLTNVYNVLKRRDPTQIEVWLAIGDLALERHDGKLAGEAFQQAVKINAEHPEAQFGLARAFAPSNDDIATTALNAVLKINPQHLPALLMVAEGQIDSEEYAAADETLNQMTAVNPQHPEALALRAVLAHLRNQPETEQQQRTAALKFWTTNPAVDHLLGRKLSQKYRFAEGAAAQKRALEYDPKYLPVQIQLAQDLLRLGQEEEGLKLAEQVHTTDAYHVLAYNLVTLQENLAKFRTLEADGLLVRMEAREAEIYGARVLDLLQRAQRTLTEKYAVKLTEPIIIEIFPKQQDFAIRTFGMPGGAGFLGVCFGTVITANSPASQGTTPASWEATLWHEFCHVVTLNKTKNRMPRWLSEGISVYEEGLVNPAWGQPFTPRMREMLLGDDFTPVSELSGAFLHARTPQHLQFAYFESGMVVKYLVEQHGQETLQKVLEDLAVGLPINDALGRHTGSIAELDVQFAEYARKQAQALAPDADWSTPELPRRATIDVITAWLKDHPQNYAALQLLAQRQLEEKDWEAARTTLERLRTLYPQDASPNSPYAGLARIARENGDVTAERQHLQELAALSAADLETLGRLTELSIQATDWQAAKTYVDRSLAVNPLMPETQRSAALVGEKLEDWTLAESSYRAQLMLQPLDSAELHYRLARLLSQQERYAEAKRQALLALEETPRYRAAQKLLLEILAKLPAETTVSTPADETPATSKPENVAP